MQDFVQGKYSEPSEIRIICGTEEKEVFHVDKRILTMNCNYFKSLFENGMKESSQKEIFLEIPRENFTFLLDFIYTGELEITDYKEYRMIQKLADYFQAHKLQRIIGRCPKWEKLYIKHLMIKGKFSFDSFMKGRENHKNLSYVTGRCISAAIAIAPIHLAAIVDHPLSVNSYYHLSAMYRKYIYIKNHNCAAIKLLLEWGVAADRKVEENEINCKECESLINIHQEAVKVIREFISTQSEYGKVIREFISTQSEYGRQVLLKLAEERFLIIPKVLLSRYFEYL